MNTNVLNLIIIRFLKKIIIAIGLLVSISNISYGQNKEIFRDDFSNNKNKWREIKELNYEMFFRGGLYYMIAENANTIWSIIPVDIDTEKDFIIEASIIFNWEKTAMAYLYFGVGDGNNYHFFGINKVVTNSKYNYDKAGVRIGKTIEGHSVSKSDGPSNSGELKVNFKIKDYGQPNIIKIKKKKNKISYYINDKHVYTKDFEPFFGNYIGFGTGATQNVSFDYLVIQQDQQNKSKNIVYETKRESKSTKTEINLKKAGGVYEVPVELNGVLKIDFIFDSGASEVSISPDIALTLMKTGTINEKDWLQGAYYKFADGSSAKSARFKLHSVKIGDKIVYDVTCSISNSIEAPILLGQSVLSKFGKYTFDYQKGKLIIE